MSKSEDNPSLGSVRLRDVEPGDLPTLFLHQSDPDANRMAVVFPRDAAAFDAHWAKILGDASIVAKAILYDGALAGSVSCFILDGQDAVGYWIAKEYWGRGIATRALALLLDEVTTRPLFARVAMTNVASIRVLERCGFAAASNDTAPSCPNPRKTPPAMSTGGACVVPNVQSCTPFSGR